jgi:hypothetical protein
LLHMASCTSRYIWGISQKNTLHLNNCRSLLGHATDVHHVWQICKLIPQKHPGNRLRSPHCVASHSSLAWCVVATWAEAGMFEVVHPLRPKVLVALLNWLVPIFFCFFILRKKIEQLNCSKIQLFWK